MIQKWSWNKKKKKNNSKLCKSQQYINVLLYVSLVTNLFPYLCLLGYVHTMFYPEIPRQRSEAYPRISAENLQYDMPPIRTQISPIFNGANLHVATRFGYRIKTCHRYNEEDQKISLPDSRRMIAADLGLARSWHSYQKRWNLSNNISKMSW